MELYKTVKKEAEAEQIIEKSRFTAHVKPVETKEEADEFIASVKSRYKDATHNVPAMVLGDKFQIQWASDDGEPQGTSGAPIVQMLVKEGITNVAVVVTRYFGGNKARDRWSCACIYQQCETRNRCSTSLRCLRDLLA